LITEGFSSARGHHDQRILSGQNGIKDCFLAGPKFLEPEGPLHEMAGLKEELAFIKRVMHRLIHHDAFWKKFWNIGHGNDARIVIKRLR
jgi:hypothetical protein